MADHPAALAGCEFQQIDIIKPETVCRYTQIIFGDTGNRFGDQTFTGTGFPGKALTGPAAVINSMVKLRISSNGIIQPPH